MDFDHPRISALVIGALAVFLVYRRLRASFGFQPVRPVRMAIRVVLLLTVAVVMLPLATDSSQFLATQSAGVIVGAALGAWGARRTRYRREKSRLYYRPHAYAGMVISALVIGRLVYRAVEWYSTRGTRPVFDPALDPSAAPMVQMAHSPLTVGLLFVLVGYYACYYGAVLWKAGRISPEDLEVAGTPTAAATVAGDALPADSNRL